MKRIVTTLALLAVTASAAFAANPLRISQVYGGGGGSTGTYLKDYVELYNNGNVAVNIGGWVLEYGSSAGNWGSSATNIFTFPVGTTIQPCQYMLIELGAPGTAGAALPVPADFSTTNLSMSSSSGKIALMSAPNANTACGLEAAGTIVDKVSYGTGNCPETTNVGLLSSTSGAVRNNAGVQDTDSNLADFTIVANPVPRNTASARNASCLVTPTSKSTWGAVKSIYR